MMRKYDCLVYIDSFQPLSNKQVKTIEAALERCSALLILIPQAHLPQTIHNPFNFLEQKAMLKAQFREHASKRLIVQGIFAPFDSQIAWQFCVQRKVNQVIRSLGSKIGFAIGSPLPFDSPLYFPQWESLSLNMDSGQSDNPLDLNEKLFESNFKTQLEQEKLQSVLPPLICNYLQAFINSPSFHRLRQEKEAVMRYRSSWAKAPYAPIFSTVDALCIQDAHVLLIRRNNPPCRGFWALPGGFIDSSESSLDAAIRELKEETNIALETAQLKRAWVKKACFDDPLRSVRGRTITQVFYFHMPGGPVLPSVNAGDDAGEAQWFPLANVHQLTLCEDHGQIMCQMLGMPLLLDA